MRRVVSWLVFFVLVAGLGPGCGPDETPAPPETGVEPQNGDGAVRVTDSGSGITVSNGTTEPLTARVSYVVPAAEEGFVNVCNPYAEPGNRSAIAPEEPFSEYDQVLLPGGRLSVGTAVCGAYVGYSVTVRNAEGEIVFEEYR